MPTLTIRFQKFDNYNNPVFIANQTDSKGDEPETYAKLNEYHQKLVARRFGTFLPIYSNPEGRYATIRFKKSDKYNRMQPRNVYEVDFNITTITKGSKTYVNCYINSLKLIRKAPTLDMGEILDLDNIY